MTGPQPVGRRAFLLGSAATAAAVLAGCSGDGEDGAARSSTTRRPPAADPAPGAADRAEAAALAAWPLVTTVRTMQLFADLVGLNRVLTAPGLTDPAARRVVAPNRDTVYVLAILDLRAGPQAVTIPPIDRYHVFPFLDAWMGDVALIGTRTNGDGGGTWVLARPGQDADLPPGAQRLEAPTDHVLMLGRIRAADDADAAAAVVLGRQVTLRTVGPPSGTASLAKAAGTPQTVGANGLGFWDETCAVLATDPPTTGRQRSALAGAAALGVRAGARPSADGDPTHREALAAGLRAARRAVARPSVAGGRVIDGWNVNLDLTGAEDDAGLRRRATIARWFWGPVPAAEAVYPSATDDAEGRPLDGAHRYRIRFAADALPPVDAFWSITAYGPDHFLVPNEAGRYSISGDTPGLVRGADGGIDLYLQHGAPPGHEANWLPVPAGRFNLVMRLYLPQRPILDGTYRYPPITRA